MVLAVFLSQKGGATLYKGTEYSYDATLIKGFYFTSKDPTSPDYSPFNYSFDDIAGADTLFLMWGIPDNICSQINKAMTGDSTIPVVAVKYNNAVPRMQRVGCIRSTPDAGQNLYIHLIDDPS